MWYIVDGVLAIGLIVFAACFDDIRENRASTKMLAAIDKDELNKAKEIYVDYTGWKNDLRDELALLFWAYVEKDDITNAEKIFKMSKFTLYGRVISDYDRVSNDVARHIYNYYITIGEYDKARAMIENADADIYIWGAHIMDVVTDMCEKGEKEKAKKYLNKYSGNINDHYDNLGDSKYVIKLIKAQIANY